MLDTNIISFIKILDETHVEKLCKFDIHNGNGNEVTQSLCPSD